MNNLEQGSAGISLAQEAHISQYPAITIKRKPSLAESITQLRAQIQGDADQFQEAKVEPAIALSKAAQLLQPAKPTWQPLQPKPKGPEGFMGLLGLESLEEYEAYKKAQERPYMPPPPLLEELLDIEVLRPKRGSRAKTEGAGALARFLDMKARIALAERPDLYIDGVPPAQIVVHLPAEAIRESVGVCEETLRRYVADLRLSGYLDNAPHVTTTTIIEGGQKRQVDYMDGTLYAIRLVPGHQARLTKEDYKREYRNLDADRKAGNTAYNLVRNAYERQLSPEERETLEALIAAEKATEAEKEKARTDEEKNCGSHRLYKWVTKVKGLLSVEKLEKARQEISKALELWVVTPGQISTTKSTILKSDPHSFLARITDQLNTVQDIVYSLGLLTTCPYETRPQFVAALATVMSREIDSGKNHKAFCKLIWQAYKYEQAGHAGLDSLTRVMRRIMIARRECNDKNKPRGGLLTKWWRAEMEQSGVGWLNASD